MSRGRCVCHAGAVDVTWALCVSRDVCHVLRLDCRPIRMQQQLLGVRVTNQNAADNRIVVQHTCCFWNTCISAVKAELVVLWYLLRVYLSIYSLLRVHLLLALDRSSASLGNKGFWGRWFILRLIVFF